MKTITFVLPNYSRIPIGGYKICFEYANRLVEDGFNVNILFLNQNALKRYIIPKQIKKIVANYFTQREPKWFQLNSKVKKFSGKSNLTKLIAATDIVVATAASTVATTYNFFNGKSKLFYLIQGYENWNMSDRELYDTYNLGFKKIVVAQWLKDVVDSHSTTPAEYVQNPLDTNKYTVLNSIVNRDKYSIGMLYHTRKIKGSIYTIKALQNVKRIYPNLKVKAFGATPRPSILPSWFEYTENATQDQTIQIYNNISIFVNGTIKEGFGLTGLEAMACGAALVSTNYLGVKEYAQNGINAYLSPIKSVEGLSKNIVNLIENPGKRISLAEKGAEDAKEFSWDQALKKFEKIIVDD